MALSLTSDRRFAFGEAVYSNGGLFGPVQRSYLSFFAVHAGVAHVEVDGRAIILASGRCCLVLNTQSLLVRCPRGKSTSLGWCENRPAVDLPLLQLELSDLPDQIPVSPRIETLLRLGMDLGLRREPYVNELRNALGEALFSAYLLEARAADANRPMPQTVQRARRFAEAHHHQDCNLRLMAKAARVSPQYLVSAFRKHLGLTPARYLWRLRAVHGLDLLQRSSLPIAEISYQCGYKNPYHFSRQIKSFFGESPKSLRQQRGFIEMSGAAEGAPDIYY